MEKYYGGRIYTDYYRKKYSVKDEKPIPIELGAITKEGHLKKLHPCWNQVLSFSTNKLFPFQFPITDRFVSPYRKRNIPVTCRITINYSRNTLSFQRKEIGSRLNDIGISIEKVNHYRYSKELRNSKIGVSPFGAGEFTWRDFELIINGCMRVYAFET